MKPVVYLLAAICAVLTDFGSSGYPNIVFFRYIEAGFAPDELVIATTALLLLHWNSLMFRRLLLRNRGRSLVLPDAESQASNYSRKWRRSRREDFFHPELQPFDKQLFPRLVLSLRPVQKTYAERRERLKLLMLFCLEQLNT